MRVGVFVSTAGLLQPIEVVGSSCVKFLYSYEPWLIPNGDFFIPSIRIILCLIMMRISLKLFAGQVA